MDPNLIVMAAMAHCHGVATATTSRRVAVRPRAEPWTARLWRALKRWWQRLWMDDMTAYLSEATSHADLEQRIRAWDEAQRRRDMPFI